MATTQGDYRRKINSAITYSSRMAEIHNAGASALACATLLQLPTDAFLFGDGQPG
jgi:hypothetical protein